MEREVGDEVFSEDVGSIKKTWIEGRMGGTIETAQGNRVIRHSWWQSILLLFLPLSTFSILLFFKAEYPKQGIC